MQAVKKVDFMSFFCLKPGSKVDIKQDYYRGACVTEDKHGFEMCPIVSWTMRYRQGWIRKRIYDDLRRQGIDVPYSDIDDIEQTVYEFMLRTRPKEEPRANLLSRLTDGAIALYKREWLGMATDDEVLAPCGDWHDPKHTSEAKVMLEAMGYGAGIPDTSACQEYHEVDEAFSGAADASSDAAKQ
jgi:hypothetical protein